MTRPAVLVPTADVGKRGIEDYWQPQRDGVSAVAWPQQSSLACGSQQVSSTVELQQLLTTSPGAVGSTHTGNETVVRDCVRTCARGSRSRARSGSSPVRTRRRSTGSYSMSKNAQQPPSTSSVRSSRPVGGSSEKRT